MTENFKPANKDVMALYILVGEAICKIQILEDALNHSIILKNDVKTQHRISRQEADLLLEKNRSLTLGQIIKYVKESELYSVTLLTDLSVFLEERNWLVHKCMPYNIDDFEKGVGKDILFRRINAIAKRAEIIRREVETDLIEYSESKGMDMSRVRAEIESNRF